MDSKSLAIGCITREDALRKIDGNHIYIFGVCETCFVFLRLFAEKVNVIGFVDNGLRGKEVLGKTILGIDDLVSIRKKDEKVVITATMSTPSMAESLIKRGMIIGEDFFVFDNHGAFHTDNAIKTFIDLNRFIWRRCRNSDSNILISLWRCADITNVIYAYVANYLADKYDAGICAYVRGGYDESVITEPLREIYNSFGCEEIFSAICSEEQLDRARIIYESIWPNIRTIDDWHRISVLGVEIGTTIVQTYMRNENILCREYDESNWGEYLYRSICTCVFWHDFFQRRNISSVVLIDYGNYDAYIRDYACAIGIPVYSIHYKDARKLTLGYSQKENSLWYERYYSFWKQLSAKEKEYGIKWAKAEITAHIGGRASYGYKKSPFMNVERTSVLVKNDKIKVMICPHIFDEDPMYAGWQIFGSYLGWLNHLSEVSQNTDYDWYIKMHPHEGIRGKVFFDKYINDNPQIKLIPDDVSPVQLKEEGMDFALTVYGSIGYEYPYLGIQVINAGNNPHISFDFSWNPRTKEEYDKLLYGLDKLNKRINREEIYEFYCIEYLYYNRIGSLNWKRFFNNQDIISDDDWGPWQIDLFEKEWTLDRHCEILVNVEEAFEEMDSWNVDTFYKNDIKID